MAGIYSIFGIENRVAFFGVQAILYLISCLCFAWAFARRTSPRIATITLWFLLFLPSVQHIIFSADRELLALSLFLLFTTAALELIAKPSWKWAILLALPLGFLLITYSPYVYLPLFVFACFLLLKVPWRYVLVCLLITLIPVGVWAARNDRITGSFCLTRCHSLAVVWYVRGEQAEQVHGLEPFWCLWAEYISRDWHPVAAVVSMR